MVIVLSGSRFYALVYHDKKKTRSSSFPFLTLFTYFPSAPTFDIWGLVSNSKGYFETLILNPIRCRVLFLGICSEDIRGVRHNRDPGQWQLDPGLCLRKLSSESERVASDKTNGRRCPQPGQRPVWGRTLGLGHQAWLIPGEEKEGSS